MQGLLESCPGLKIIATSREPLDLSGETIWRVPPLSLPGPGEVSKATDQLPARIISYDSVRLFVERAAAVLPAFQLTPENAGAMSAICQKLDGIPLAIELAAARVKVLTVGEILLRLDHRFAFLPRVPQPGKDPRYQTLQGAIDWSYQLLTETERVSLHSLSVFEGGFTLVEAEAIFPPAAAPGSILDPLTGLVDKSMLIAETMGPGQARYR